MKVLWRVIAGVISILLVVGISIVVWLSFFFNLENYRDPLIGWIAEGTGSDVAIHGDLKFDLDISTQGPMFKFVVGGLSLKGEGEFSSVELFSAAKVELALSARNLVLGRLEPMITMVNPQLNLIRVDKNIANWHNVGSNLLDGQQELSEWDLITAFSGISLMGLRIVDGAVRWTHTSKQDDLRISEIDLEVIPRDLRRTVLLQANLHSTTMPFDGITYVDSSLELAIDKKSGSLYAKDVILNLTGPLTMVSLDIEQMQIDQERERFSIGDTNLSGAVQGEEFVFILDKGVYSQMTDSLVLENVETKWIDAQLEGIAHLSMFTISSIKEIFFEYFSNHGFFASKFETIDEVVTIFDHGLRASGRINLSVPDWNSLAFSDFKLSAGRDGAFGAIIDLSIGEYGTDVDNFDLGWADSKMRGSLTHIGTGQMSLKFEVIEEHVDLESASLFGAQVIDNPAISLLGMLLSHTEIISTGNVEIGRVLWGGMSASRLNIPLSTKTDIWQANDVTFDLYGGNGISEFVIRRTNSGLVLDARQNYFGVDVGSVLSKAGITDRLQAVGNLEVVIATPLNTSVIESLRGRITIVIPKGQVNRLEDLVPPDKNLFRAVEEILAPIGLDWDLNIMQDDIKFSEFQARISLKDGHLYSDDISLRTSGWDLAAQAKYDLIQDRYDSIWYLSPVDQMESDENAFVNRLRALIIPIRVSGQSRSISVALDIPELLQLLSP